MVVVSVVVLFYLVVVFSFVTRRSGLVGCDVARPRCLLGSRVEVWVNYGVKFVF